MKIAVYAIAKNEEAFVERFCQSAKDADLILIADTGSTDGTVEKARACGAVVHNIHISPWRFDKARDAALALLPADVDICISLDLDEVLTEGWREEVERVWQEDTTRLRYLFEWGPGITFHSTKLHARHGYHWHHPCHEYIRADGRIEEVYAQTNKLLIVHKPDNTKSRAQYLPLLKLSVEEDPHCPRNAFYYARELYFYRQWETALDALDNYLAMPNAEWNVERGYAWRVKGLCYKNLGDTSAAIECFLASAKEDPTSREPLVELAQIFYEKQDWGSCYAYSEKALEIKTKPNYYTVEPEAWGEKPHDLLAIAAYNLETYNIALLHGKLASELAPENQRLQDNMKFYQLKAA